MQFKPQSSCASVNRPSRSAVLALLAVALLTYLSRPITSAAETPACPNIVLIMADDMGYSDIGCYGGEIETPTLNRLATGGMRFTQFYNTGRCCPTRAALLTGLYSHQAGVGWMMTDRGHDGYRGDLNKRCVTIAEALRPAGYSTYMSGKWHVTPHVRPDGPKHNWPRQRGFDRFYGTIHGAGSFYDPNSLTRDNTQISPTNDPQYKPKQYYYTDAISDHAVRFINEHQAATPDKPLFMYVAYTAAHWPMHAFEKDIAKYRGKYDAGYAVVRDARLNRMRKMGLLSPDWAMTPQAEDWNTVKNREWEIACMEVYAAMVDSMDQGIGRIVDALDSTKDLDNTLILFLQDNGGCAKGLGRAPRNGLLARPDKPTLPVLKPGFLQDQMIPPQTRDGYPTVMGPGVMPGPDGTYIAYGRGWANVSNTPFREYKHWVHEGGVATPLIAHWPAMMKRHGKLDNQPGHLIDLMATCVDVAQAKYPLKIGDNKITPLEGTSLAPAFVGEDIGRRNPIFWEHEGNRAIRDGKWKLVAKENRPWELFDMEGDRTELHDLVDKLPGRAKDLKAKWDAWAARADVLPLGAWRGAPKQANFNKKQKRFSLKQGADLPRERAPFTENRTLSISARLSDVTDGVIVGQGGIADGYSLYVKSGKLVFATRHSGKLTVISCDSSLPSRTKVDAELLADGQVHLKVDGKQSASGTTPGSIRMPVDGLQVGSDKNGAVGEYESPFAFGGKISDVVISAMNN